jgi:hypothetical protein
MQRREEYVHRSINIHGVRREGIRHRPGNRSESGFMKHEVHTHRGIQAGVEVADIGLDQTEASPNVLANGCAYSLEILPVSGAEIVKAHDFLVHTEQFRYEMRPDETGCAGDQPTLRCHGHRLHTRYRPHLTASSTRRMAASLRDRALP